MALGNEFDGFLVDLDGVVWIGPEMVSGAVEALRELIEGGKRLAFVTNNPGKPAAAYAERLRENGVEVGDEQVVTAGEATARLVRERIGVDGKAYVIGAPALHDSIAEAGLELVAGETPSGKGQARESAGEAGPRPSRVDAVVVSGHREFDYAELLSATRALQRGALLFATSRDPTLPMPGGPWPGTGAVLAAVETASGARAEIGGKPERPLFDLARQRLDGAERVAMVGDRVSSDVEGGRRAGLETILVLSGATSRAEAEAASPAPDRIVASLAELVR